MANVRTLEDLETGDREVEEHEWGEGQVGRD